MERKVQIAEIEEDEDDDGHCMETSDLLFRYKTSSLFSVDDGGTKTGQRHDDVTTGIFPVLR